MDKELSPGLWKAYSLKIRSCPASTMDSGRHHDINQNTISIRRSDYLGDKVFLLDNLRKKAGCRKDRESSGLEEFTQFLRFNYKILCSCHCRKNNSMLATAFYTEGIFSLDSGLVLRNKCTSSPVSLYKIKGLGDFRKYHLGNGTLVLDKCWIEKNFELEVVDKGKVGKVEPGRFHFWYSTGCVHLTFEPLLKPTPTVITISPNTCEPSASSEKDEYSILTPIQDSTGITVKCDRKLKKEPSMDSKADLLELDDIVVIPVTTTAIKTEAVARFHGEVQVAPHHIDSNIDAVPGPSNAIFISDDLCSKSISAKSVSRSFKPKSAILWQKPTMDGAKNTKAHPQNASSSSTGTGYIKSGCKKRTNFGTAANNSKESLDIQVKEKMIEIKKQELSDEKKKLERLCTTYKRLFKLRRARIRTLETDMKLLQNDLGIRKMDKRRRQLEKQKIVLEREKYEALAL